MSDACNLRALDCLGRAFVRRGRTRDLLGKLTGYAGEFPLTYVVLAVVREGAQSRAIPLGVIAPGRPGYF